MSTKIDWVINPDGTKGETLNVTTGCTPISAGCNKCYAEKMTKRLHAMGMYKYRNGFKLTLHPDEIKKPYKWKKPRTVFINSMSDLFHKDVPDEFIMQVFEMMNANPRHTFILLTKRPERLVLLNDKLNWTDNIWMGVTVESSEKLCRIDNLKECEAKIKFISFEPLIKKATQSKLFMNCYNQLRPYEKIDHWLKGVDWVIVGGETGAGARPMVPDWVHLIYASCERNNIPFFFKGWGTATMKKTDPSYFKFGGKEWREMPTNPTGTR